MRKAAVLFIIITVSVTSAEDETKNPTVTSPKGDDSGNVDCGGGGKWPPPTECFGGGGSGGIGGGNGDGVSSGGSGGSGNGGFGGSGSGGFGGTNGGSGVSGSGSLGGSGSGCHGGSGTGFESPYGPMTTSGSTSAKGYLLELGPLVFAMLPLYNLLEEKTHF